MVPELLKGLKRVLKGGGQVRADGVAGRWRRAELEAWRAKGWVGRRGTVCWLIVQTETE